jgi:hypothetical protein
MHSKIEQAREAAVRDMRRTGQPGRASIAVILPLPSCGNVVHRPECGMNIQLQNS